MTLVATKSIQMKITQIRMSWLKTTENSSRRVSWTGTVILLSPLGYTPEQPSSCHMHLWCCWCGTWLQSLVGTPLGGSLPLSGTSQRGWHRGRRTTQSSWTGRTNSSTAPCRLESSRQLQAWLEHLRAPPDLALDPQSFWQLCSGPRPTRQSP